MKSQLILFFLCSSIIGTACSNNRNNSIQNDTNFEQNDEQKEKISLDDKKIIENHKKLIKNLDMSNRINVENELRKNLLEIEKIQNKQEREKIQKNIYLSLGMYQEAYDLNEKQLSKNPSPQKQFIKCELMQSLKFDDNKIKKCHEISAQNIQKELKATSKNDPLYSYGEWTYLLEMYKAGHSEYKQKMQDYINSTTDEKMKFQFQSSFELATQ